jgi:hypothetical protein
MRTVPRRDRGNTRGFPILEPLGNQPVTTSSPPGHPTGAGAFIGSAGIHEAREDTLRTSRVTVAAVAAAMLTGAFAAGPAAAGPPPKPHAPLTIAVYGDSPYGTSPTDTAEFNQDAAAGAIDQLRSRCQLGHARR